MDAWRELDEPWRVSLELAWEAYLADTIPVGSVVAGPDGGIVARGRNRIFDPPGRGLAGSRLAHAEVDALVKLPVTDRYRDHVLYSTLEPCLLCVAATLHATVGRIEYATADPFGGGCNGGDRHRSLEAKRAHDRDAARHLGGRTVGGVAERLLAGAPRPSACRGDRRSVRGRRTPSG
jgi:tRNA(Arg) A34 adenosine deaminase TadA